MFDDNTGQDEVPAIRSFLIKPSIWNRLRATALTRDGTASAVVRRIILEYLDEYEVEGTPEDLPALRVGQPLESTAETAAVLAEME